MTDDPYLWLEDVQGEPALAWVRARNAEAEAVLTTLPRYAQARAAILDALDSKDQVPWIARRGAHVYNFWRDAAHPRGLWRRTTLDDYRRAEPAWELVLDLDALAAAEGENWVWAGATALGPAYRRCLVSLSRGGADATVVREFDLVERRFVDGGFALPEAKTAVTWRDEDHLYVGTDTGPGSLTDSGYPRTVRLWRRGTPLAAAPVVFEGEAGDVSAWVSVDRTPGFERTVFGRSLDFYNTRVWLAEGDRLRPVDKPDDASLSFWRERVLVELRSPWLGHPAGSLLAADAAACLRGERTLVPVFTPTPTCSLQGWTVTASTVVLSLLDDVKGRLEAWSPDGTRRALPVPGPGSCGASALHDPLLVADPLAEQLLLTYTDFLTPESLWLAQADGSAPALLKTRPPLFDAAGMRTEQHFATSADGTRVPYFVVFPAGAAEGDERPTLLSGYGGFEIARLPVYSAAIGRAWLAQGGVYVLANLRGGGEYGPAWHQAAIRERKQKSYDDLAAVAEDIVRRRITRPQRLGIQGGSNGGLLVGAVMLQRPELFNAVVCQVPLLDMRRYHRLLAGASWMAEYGNPDEPADWAFISRYSPYQNVQPGVKLPRVLFTTSTRDDRVHPGHARKMAARMREQGHDLLYWENLEGGHGGAADNAQRATMLALEFAFLHLQLAC